MKAVRFLTAILPVFLLFAAFRPVQASAANLSGASVDPAHEFIGTWLLEFKGAKRKRIVIVEGTAQAENGGLVFTGKIGFADRKKRKPVNHGRVEHLAGAYGLSFFISHHRKLVFREVSENRLEGIWPTLNGGVPPADMTRADAATVKEASIPVKRHSVIRVIYIGAMNCTICRYWERHYEKAWKQSPLFAKVVYNEIMVATYEYTADPTYWPDNLKWVIAGGRRYYSGTPRFVIVVDHRIVKSIRSASGWQSAVLPLVHRLVGRRDKLASHG